MIVEFHLVPAVFVFGVLGGLLCNPVKLFRLLAYLRGEIVT